MNRRERILAVVALAVVILAGGGFLFKFLFLDALSAVQAQIDDAQKDIEAKKADLKKEGDDVQAIQRRDPRLLQWQRLSLPDDKDLAQEVKSGHTPEEAKKRHEDIVQVEYEQFLRQLVVGSGFDQNSIKISASAERKAGPPLTGKTPAYTKFTFTVQGQAGFDSVVRLLDDFYRTPLLHQVRSLTLTSRQQARPAQPAGFPVPGAAAPGGPAAGFPGGPRPGGFPGGPGAAPGGFPGASPGGRNGGDLDVNMTVEALLVNGAEKREKLLPESTVAVRALADPSRRYTDMLAKNIFTGIASEAKLKEDPAQVLNFVRLTAIWNNGRRWQATIYDQGKGGDETHLKPPVLDEFSITDKYGNVLVRGKALKLDEDGLIFQYDDKVYRWRCGEFLGPVLETPLKSSELRELGVKTASASPEN